MALRLRPSAARAPVKPAANAGLTLFIAADSLDSDWALLVLKEKDIEAAVVQIVPGRPNEDFLILNPAQTLPTVSDREGVIAGARVIVEYLDERYPHPSLMPLSPSGRARVRMALSRIEQELFPLANQLLADARATAPARKTLLAGLDAGMRFFPSRGWFCGTEYSLADTAWAVLLRTLHLRGIDMAKTAAPLQSYAERLFARPAFQRSFVRSAQRPVVAKSR
jgi:RNA polymerase-associated protein